ncbi:hypothetical protein GOP47_0013066 [Adiantum capillus-veneris]|uniref:Uncharacterized protein n=1 Tax=Adiantum capillus-veneris TaxID=13818 RepID=A0A9D4URW5_ADICA|nr:hypothetical protein GOP47_0013066 [Adiantum capillus-veneris]
MDSLSVVSLGWIDWASAWLHVTTETLLQRIYTCHLPQRLPLPVLTDFTCIITGATSGIGLETAKQLAEVGAHVVLACRNTKVAQALVHDWQKEREHYSGPLDVEVMELNLLSLSSVRAFAAAWEARQGPLHVLINNAGIFSMSAPQKFSEDGLEEHMQVNHLAPALLTLLLLPSLSRGAPSRVVNVNSDMQAFGVVDPNDLNLNSGRRKYSSTAAYSGSKLAQIYFSSVLETKLPNDCGIHVICVNPGIVKTNVTRTLPKFVQAVYNLVGFFSLSSLEGARSVLFCSTDPQVLEYAEALRAEGWPVCPYYSSDCKPNPTSKHAQNVGMAFKLWDKTREIIGLNNEDVDKLLDGATTSTPCLKESFFSTYDDE